MIDSKSIAFAGVWVRVPLAVPFENVRFDTKYQAFFCTFIGVRVSYVLVVINKYSSNNDVYIRKCVYFLVIFVKLFDMVVSNY